MTRVLQVVKTTDGARWAAWQARALTQLGVEVHVVLPSTQGEAVRLWHESGARIHIADFSLPFKHPERWTQRRSEMLDVLRQIEPDLIHSHFVTNTLALRLALGRRHPIPILFQVPGPLHMESPLLRRMDLATAGAQDYWIPSSQYTRKLYLDSHAPKNHLFLSYYGFPLAQVESARVGTLRAQMGVGASEPVIGNINNIYPPKYIVGQTIGSKGHEYVIDALALVCQERRDVTGVLIGGQWNGGAGYRESLVKRARQKVGDRIRFVENVGFVKVNQLWADYDCAVHLPISENCGGVIEPLAAEVPTVASRVGGLPEVILDNVTGALVPPRDPTKGAERILETLEYPAQAKERARVGRALVLEMFDIARTAQEIANIYEYVLGLSHTLPTEYDSVRRTKTQRMNEVAV